MARVNPTEFAILGLLAREPRSGYDIKKEVEEQLSHFWSESYGHIYPMLRRLHDRDLIVKHTQRQEGRPDRNVYHLTDDGRRALEDWFAEPPSPPRPRNEILLRIFLGRYAPAEHLLRDVRALRSTAEERLEQLGGVRQAIEAEETGHPDRVFWDLVLEHGELVYAALAEWSKRAEERLGEVEEGSGSRG